jgi:two-component system sensor histidine kinase DegS
MDIEASTSPEQAAPPTMDQVIEEAQAEYDQTQKELKEIELLIRQSTNEVEKLAQRNAQVSNKLRLIENNLDTMPRQDIKEIYKLAQDTQSRLFMMRGQVEQLQSKQQQLAHFAERLHLIINTYHSTSRPSDVGIGDSAVQEQTPESSIMNIINAQERERLYLSKQLHDGPAQSLTNLILQAEICERLFDKDPMRAKSELSNLKEAVNNTFQKIREYIFQLRPMMLDDLGLTPTLKQYVQEFETKRGLATNLLISGGEHRLPPHIEVTLFRVIQALLNNVADHANATHIQISFDIQGDRVTARIEDDGSGFDVEEAKARAKKQKQMGLISMQEQITMLRGEIEFDSSIGQGTVVSLWLPIE